MRLQRLSDQSERLQPLKEEAGLLFFYFMVVEGGLINHVRTIQEHEEQ